MGRKRGGSVAHKRGIAAVNQATDIDVDVQQQGQWNPASRYDTPYIEGLSTKNVQLAAAVYARSKKVT